MKQFKTFITEENELERFQLIRKVIEKGNEDQVGKFLDHPMILIRAAVARRAFKPHLDKLVNDYSPDVREEVARYGDKKHLDKLIDDPKPLVRCRVAKYGSDEHRDRLIKDPSNDVRMEVARHGNEGHRRKLWDDKDVKVRGEVAGHSTDPFIHLNLMHDPDSHVRWRLAENPNISLRHLKMMEQHDPDEDVQYVAGVNHANRSWPHPVIPWDQQ